MITGFGTTMDKPLWSILKKHYCNKCNSKLKLIRITKILKDGTEEHKKAMREMVKNPLLRGGFKLKEVKFKCTNCDNTIDIIDQYEYEKKLKK